MKNVKKACGSLLFALLGVCLLLCACAREQDAQVQKDYTGFTEPMQHKTGGLAQQQVNAKSLTAVREGEDIRLTLSFVSGSRFSGSEREADFLALPAYDVSLTQTPTRLLIELPGLSYWDYARTLDITRTPEIQGCFRHILADDDTVCIYVQLASAYVFRLEETQSALSVILRPVEQTETQDDGIADLTDSGSHYYVMADAYNDYCSGVLSVEMSPVLAADRERVVLISAPFATPMEAESFRTDTLKLNPDALEAQWSVIELADGAMPPYSAEMNYRAAYEQHVCRINGEERTATVFLEDGLYLCTRPEKNGVLYSKRMEGGEAGERYTYELLYTADLAGNKKRLFPYEFETVEAARYSPDGRKLAVLERAEESAHLYVFDIAAKELLVDLTDMGFGDMISAFTWDALGSTIYAVSGTDAMQVHQYDFNVPDEGKRYTLVDKAGADEGSLAFLDGEIYFAQTDLSGATIYSIKPQGGVRKAFAEGGSFELSQDGRYMAINSAAGDFAAQSSEAAFRIYNMETGQTTPVTDAFSVYDFFWSRDCTKLYYFESRLSGGVSEEASSDDTDTAAQADAFPYTLWAYDLTTGQNAALMDLPTTLVYQSGLSDAFYMCYTDVATMGGAIRATYSLDAG